MSPTVHIMNWFTHCNSMEMGKIYMCIYVFVSHFNVYIYTKIILYNYIVEICFIIKFRINVLSNICKL